MNPYFGSWDKLIYKYPNLNIELKWMLQHIFEKFEEVGHFELN